MAMPIRLTESSNYCCNKGEFILDDMYNILKLYADDQCILSDK